MPSDKTEQDKFIICGYFSEISRILEINPPLTLTVLFFIILEYFCSKNSVFL